MLCNSIHCISVILIFVLGFKGYGQTKPFTQLKVDRLTDVADSLYKIKNLEQSKSAYAQVVKASKDLDYSKGRAVGYHGLSKISWFEEKFDESTQYLILANQEVYTQSDAYLKSKIYFSMALNLHTISMFEDALKYYKLSMNLSDQIKDEYLRNQVKISSYQNMGDIYDYTGKSDSAIYYFQKTLHHKDSDVENKLVASMSLAEFYIKKGEIDSVDKYVAKLKNLPQLDKHENDYGYYWRKVFAKREFLKGNYLKAIEIFHQIDDSEFQKKEFDLELYRYLAESYKKLGNQDSSNYYLEKYLTTSLEREEKNKQMIFNNKKVPSMIYGEEKKSMRNKYYARIAIILGVVFMVFIPIIYLLFSQKKKLLAKHEETDVLKKQLNSAFDEIVDLAKTNSPNFLPRFLEVYPEFHQAIINYEPNLTNSELMLAAYLKLDFSTKEIADYNFVSIRTVQNRRYRLRKKLNLDAKIDLNHWLQNLTLKSNYLVEV
jgi:tetratricopeptide (TPR) repeat protein